MKRTIRMSMGGSSNHTKEKVIFDGSVVYRNDDLRQVYHQLFDESLEAFNEKETRVERKIPDYFDKICNSRQEKAIPRIDVHIGNRNDTTSDSGYGKLVGRILKEYYKSFQIRNPNLRIFAAQLRMNTPTPRLEIGFVPFTTGSKRGLATRVCPSDRRLYNRDFADEMQEIQLCRSGYFLKKNSLQNS